MRRPLVVLLVMLVVAGACRKQGAAPPMKRARTMADSAEQVMLNVRTLLVDRGVQRGEMFADTAYVFDDSKRFELRRVRATFNSTMGAKNGVMSADRGRYSMNEQLLEGFGNVVIVTNEGKRLSSPYLKYMQGLNEVSTDTNFTLVEPGRTVSGIGFTADPQLTRIKVLRSTQARGSLTLPAQ